jgi:hypothetical protein
MFEFYAKLSRKLRVVERQRMIVLVDKSMADQQMDNHID